MSRFERDCVEHLRLFAPLHCRILEGADLLGTIRFGVAQARRHGFSARGPVRFYIELIFLFGAHFDTDPMLPWVVGPLGDRGEPSELVRAERLYAAMQDHLTAVAGPDGAHARAALIRVAADRGRFEIADGAAPDAAIAARLRAAYPEKCAAAGEGATERLVAGARARAEAMGLDTPGTVAALSGLAFAFGHGCLDDPHLPWIGRTLARNVHPSGDDIERLRARALAYLDRVAAAVGAC